MSIKENVAVEVIHSQNLNAQMVTVFWIGTQPYQQLCETAVLKPTSALR